MGTTSKGRDGKGREIGGEKERGERRGKGRRRGEGRSKIKNGGLNQYGAGAFEHQQFGTAGVEGVKVPYQCSYLCMVSVAILALGICSLGVYIVRRML